MCIFSSLILKIALCSRVNSGAASKWLNTYKWRAVRGRPFSLLYLTWKFMFEKLPKKFFFFLVIKQKVRPKSEFWDKNLVSEFWPNTGNGVLARKYLILSRSDALSYVENHYWKLILEPEICLFEVTSLTLFYKPSFLVAHSFSI